MKVDRHERLMKSRADLANVSRDSGWDITRMAHLVEAIDNLYFEMDLLLHEIEGLKEAERDRI